MMGLLGYLSWAQAKEGRASRAGDRRRSNRAVEDAFRLLYFTQICAQDCNVRRVKIDVVLYAFVVLKGLFASGRSALGGTADDPNELATPDLAGDAGFAIQIAHFIASITA